MNKPDISLLIPTYQRTVLLRRCLTYLQQYLPFISPDNIYVLDGSPSGQYENKEICAEFQVNYRYFENGELPRFRVHQVLKCLETEFVAILADDDLIHPTGLLEAIAFLIEHPDFVVAHGAYFTYFQQDEHNCLAVKSVYEGKPSLEADNPLARLLDFMCDYYPLHYGIHRTAVLRTVYNEVITHLDNYVRVFPELYIASLEVALGKVKKLDTPYCVRQMGNRAEAGNRVSWPEFIFSEKFNGYYQALKSSLKDTLRSQTVLTDEQLNSAIDNLYFIYLGQLIKVPTFRSMFVKTYCTGKSSKQSKKPTIKQESQQTQQSKGFGLNYIKKLFSNARSLSKSAAVQQVEPESQSPENKVDLILAFLNDYKPTGKQGVSV